MTGPELISIITPAYNASRFIGETIRSVAAQSCQNWEMIIVDDCSLDNTCSLIDEFAKQDPRIRLIRHAINGGGPAKARNTALNAANGRYVAFLDSDDLWLPDKLERQLRFMESHRSALSFTSFRRITENGESSGQPVRIPARLHYRELLKNTAIATSTVVVDRDKTGPFEMVETYYDDFVLWLSLLKRGFVAHGFLKLQLFR